MIGPLRFYRNDKSLPFEAIEQRDGPSNHARVRGQSFERRQKPLPVHTRVGFTRPTDRAAQPARFRRA
jgi:hypothetical protein